MRPSARALALVALAGCSGAGQAPTKPVLMPEQFGTSPQTSNTVSLPPVSSGVTGSITIPSAFRGAAYLTIGFATTPPPGLPPANSAIAPSGAASQTATPIGYVSVGIGGGPVVFAESPSFTLSAPAPPLQPSFPAGTFEVYEYDANAPSSGYVALGPANVVNGSVESLSFASVQNFFTFPANDTVTLAVFDFPAP